MSFWLLSWCKHIFLIELKYGFIAFNLNFVVFVLQYENPWTIPNMLSMTRIGLAPVLGYLIIEEDFNIALGVFALAGLTDLVSCKCTPRCAPLSNPRVSGTLSLLFPGRKSSRWIWPSTLYKYLPLASVWDSVFFKGSKERSGTCWEAWERCFYSCFFFFNSFVKEKPLEIPKEPSICFRDRNKGEKLWDYFSIYCDRNILIFNNSWFYWWREKQWVSYCDQGACRGQSSMQVYAGGRL